ncbi:MAG TPA: hypothetical protein VK154_11965 [Chitinophagales bacterium]|nr:hypothetical protein [Chitinophagales bacterium]
METNQNGDKNKMAGILFVGCMFMGFGIGLLTGHQSAGIFIGMGIGFIAMVVFRMRNK